MRVFPPHLTETLGGFEYSTVSPQVAAAAAVAIVAVSTWWLFRSTMKPREAPPPARKIHVLPTTLPVLGNLLDILRRAEDRHDWMSELSQQYDGEPFLVKIPSMPDLIVVSSPELFEEVTSTQFENFIKGEFQRKSIADMLGDGLVGADGDRWYHQRKAAVKFFTARSLRSFMVHSLRKNMHQVYDVLDASQEAGTMADLGTLMHELTLQTFVEIGLGVDVDCIGAKNPHPFMHAADIAPPVVTRRARLPPPVWKLQRYFKLGPEGELARAKEVLDAWLRELVQKSLHNSAIKQQQKKKDGPHEEESSEIKSVVELFAESSQDDADGLRPEDLIDFLLTFVLAARDTTALSLTWLFFALAKYPDVEKTMRQEMATHLGELWHNEDAYLTTEHLRGLTYFEAVLKETLRLYTVVPFTRREVAQDTIIGGDIHVRKGQFIGLSAYLLSRNPKVWGPDAAEFKPERWIDSKTGELITVSTFKFFGFSSGPRTCVGMNLAMMELRVVAANLLKRYHFNVDLETNDGSYIAAPSLVMKHPLMASVKSTMAHAA